MDHTFQATHTISADLQAKAAALGLSLQQLIAMIGKYGPLINIVLNDIATVLKGGTLTPLP